MKSTICLAGALVVALALPGVAAAQNNGRGHDDHQQDKGKGHGSENRGSGNGQGQGQDHDNRGRGNDDRGHDDNRQRGQNARAPDIERRVDREVRAAARDVDRRTVVVSDGRPVLLLPRQRDRGLIAGCPPGLARKNNGCLPPGQARRIERAARYDYLWDRRDDGFVYRYDDGYLYRMNQQGSLLGYLPVLGGALGLGNPWPAQYAYEPAPRYYTDYFRLTDGNEYRYADGVLYGLDPRTQAISQVAALLTGQQWNVGQAMPAGYDVYNVPYAYRDQYVDGADRLYRYNDGYVYQVDPTTQLVQAVIQLLT